jgi:hypothetical protein
VIYAFGQSLGLFPERLRNKIAWEDVPEPSPGSFTAGHLLQKVQQLPPGGATRLAPEVCCVLDSSEHNREVGMAYVRARGSQVLIVQGERDPVTRTVGQRILFTLYSKEEAKEALADMEREGGALGSLLRRSHRGLRFDWGRLARDLRAHLHVLPDQYDAFEERVRPRFLEALRGFARRLMQADPQERATSAALLREQRPPSSSSRS